VLLLPFPSPFPSRNACAKDRVLRHLIERWIYPLPWHDKREVKQACVVWNTKPNSSFETKYKKDYWDSGLYPSSSILKKAKKLKKHDVSEAGSATVLRWRRGGEGRATQLIQLGPIERASFSHWRLALSKGPNWICCVIPPSPPLLHLRAGADRASETSCF
jgi:hypothetical protein